MFHALGRCAFVLLLATVPVGAVTAQPDGRLSLRELREKFGVAYNKRDYAQAIEIGLRVAARDPNSKVDPYNLACVYALNADIANAVKWLRRSAENGFAEVALASTDPDLAAIRKEPGYAEALKLIQENFDRERKDFERRADKSKPRVIVPPDHEASKPAPLIIVLHGYGGDADGMANTWRANARNVGAVLVAPRAVRPAMEGGFDWGRVDEADILVTRAMEQVMKEYAIDTKRIVLCGFSQGGFMAYALAFRHPEKFCGVIPIAAGYDPGLLPASGARPDKTPKFFIIVGSEDRAFRGNLRASRDLEAAGIPVELSVQEGLKHRFPKNYEVEFRKALEFVLPP